MTRKTLLIALAANSKELRAKTTYMPGDILIRALRKMLESPRGRYDVFLRYVPSRYKIQAGKLATVFRNSIMFLKNRASLGEPSAQLFRFVTAQDDRVRHNHAILHDMVFHKDHPAVNSKLPFNIVPPLEHNCRCQLVPLSREESARLIRHKGLRFYLTRKLPKGAVGYAFKQ